MPVDFVLHLGVHKTGSTLLQTNLANNVESLREQGVYYLNAEWYDAIRRTRRRLRKFQNSGAHSMAEDRLEVLNRRIERAAVEAGAHTVLISEENYLGVPSHLQHFWGMPQARFYPWAGECVRFAMYGIDPKRLRLVVYTRDQEAILRGHYAEGVRSLWTADTFDRFLERTDIESFRFDAMVTRLSAALPGAKIDVVPFEAIRSGADPFVRDFYTRCGLLPAAMTVDPAVVYGTVDADQAEELRHLAMRWVAGDRDESIRRSAKRIMARTPDKARPLVIPEPYLSRVRRMKAGDLSETLLPAA